MKTRQRLCVLFVFLLMTTPTAANPTLSSASKSATHRSFLHAGWKFRQVGKTDWYPADVPGCVHTDLLKNKLIDEPFFRDNEQKLQWIGKTDWEYHMSFNVGPEILKLQHVELVFAGLDTYAQVFLNESPLFNANNMFREWRVDGKKLLRPGENKLRIHFRSPINEVLPLMAKLEYQLPLAKPDITTLISPRRNGFLITLTTNEFAKSVYLSLSPGEGFFSDNYFDLVPGQKLELEFISRQPIKLNELRRNLKIRSLVDAF